MRAVQRTRSGSVIRNYRNLCATLSTPQYGFQKGLKIFKESGHEATIKELDKNLIGKNVLDMLDPKSVTFDMMKMSLGYLMFLKRKRDGRIKARGVLTGGHSENTSPNLNPVLPLSKLMHYL